MRTAKPFNQMTIIGKVWFNKNKGHAYHSVVVYVDGEAIGTNDYAHGSEAYIKYTALDILQENGFYTEDGGTYSNGFKVDVENFIRDMQDNRTKFLQYFHKVGTKKELAFN